MFQSGESSPEPKSKEFVIFIFYFVSTKNLQLSKLSFFPQPFFFLYFLLLFFVGPFFSLCGTNDVTGNSEGLKIVKNCQVCDIKR